MVLKPRSSAYVEIILDGDFEEVWVFLEDRLDPVRPKRNSIVRIDVPVLPRTMIWRG